MQTDQNGIAFIEDTDSISPFTTLINPLMQSVSDRVGSLTERSRDQIDMWNFVGGTVTNPRVVHYLGEIVTNGNGERVFNLSSMLGTVVYCSGVPYGGAGLPFQIAVTSGGPGAYTVKFYNHVGTLLVNSTFDAGMMFLGTAP